MLWGCEQRISESPAPQDYSSGVEVQQGTQLLNLFHQILIVMSMQEVASNIFKQTTILALN